MKGHAILKDEIESFQIDNMRMMLSENPEVFFESLIKMADRKLKVTEMGIGFDRKLLYAWKQHGLLPFSHDDKSWNRFSFIETCWLKILLEYRSIGVSIEKLKILKEKFFKSNFIEEYIDKLNELIDELTSEMWYNIHIDAPHQAHKVKGWIDQLKTQATQLNNQLTNNSNQ